MQQPGAKSCRIRDLLEHVQLATLQRGQFAASLPEKEWREFVLSPWIEGAGEDIAWRRELWEWMSPRVRRETDAEQAAEIVARELQRHMGITEADASDVGVTETWKRGQTSAAGFERLKVAAMLAAGIPARLGQSGACEVYAGGRWGPPVATFDYRHPLVPR